MEATNGVRARLDRAELDIQRLVEHKADMTELAAVKEGLSEVKTLLLWLMGLGASAMIAGFGTVIGILVS